eukprot:TRINITY_DN8414_c0_g1_i14.p2 TRINITY_DN8414_c0_g1~~TRINITY_DN8414_c0_g1_i14.p2  ORF type:complete len:136 (-),score=34.32 TRINITY_DN8414_c0_g1_i14:320-727(-)
MCIRDRQSTWGFIRKKFHIYSQMTDLVSKFKRRVDSDSDSDYSDEDQPKTSNFHDYELTHEKITYRSSDEEDNHAVEEQPKRAIISSKKAPIIIKREKVERVEETDRRDEPSRDLNDYNNPSSSRELHRDHDEVR